MLLHPDHWRSREDVDIARNVLRREFAYTSNSLQWGELSLENVVVREADLDNSSFVNWLFQKSLEFHFPFALEACIIESHQLLPVLLHHWVGIIGKLVFKGNLPNVHIFLFQSFVVNAGGTACWRATHRLRAVLYQLIQHFVVLSNLATFFFGHSDSVWHARRAVIGSLVGVVHLSHSFFRPIEPALTLLQVMVIGIVRQDILTILQHEANEFEDISAGVIACQALRDLLVAGLQPAVFVFVSILRDVSHDSLQQLHGLRYTLLIAAGFLSQ